MLYDALNGSAPLGMTLIRFLQCHLLCNCEIGHLTVSVQMADHFSFFSCESNNFPLCLCMIDHVRKQHMLFVNCFQQNLPVLIPFGECFRFHHQRIAVFIKCFVTEDG